MVYQSGLQIKVKNLDEYIKLLQQLKDIIEKLNNTRIEVEIIQSSHKG